MFYANMADDLPHDGVPPELPPVDFKEDFEAEPEAEPEPLPLSIRPLDPARYHPETHILPTVRGIKSFTNFAEDAPEDLLLREPVSHLSTIVVEGESRAFRGYGTTTARDWYGKLPAGVCDIIDETGFGLFCSSLTWVIASRPPLGALVERWWDTTNFFHFATTGEMTMTPYNFSMITGLDVGGDLIPLDSNIGEWEAAWLKLLGAHPSMYQASMARYSWFEEWFRGTEPETIEEIEQYARGFLMWNTVGLYLLSALVVLSRVQFYDWGGAGLTTLYGYMSSSSRLRGTLVRGYWRAWEVYNDQLRRRTRESFMFFRQYFDIVAVHEVTWQPWAMIPTELQAQYNAAWGISRHHILLEGLIC
ncbi:hypothetical protein ACSBR1_022212 [Camellia fascicularis]